MKIEKYEVMIDDYLVNNMQREERRNFENLMNQQPILAQEIAFRQMVLKVIKTKMEIEKLHQENIKKKQSTPNTQGKEPLQKLKFPSCKGYVFIDPKSIFMCTLNKKNKQYCIVHLENRETIEVATKLVRLEEILPTYFFRTHRNTFVNLNAVEAYENGASGKLILANGIETKIAKGRRKAFMKLFQLEKTTLK